MSASTSSDALDPQAFAELLCGGDLKGCCAAVYAHPAVRWLLGGELHPGGQATTRRALDLIGVMPGERRQLNSIWPGARPHRCVRWPFPARARDISSRTCSR